MLIFSQKFAEIFSKVSFNSKYEMHFAEMTPQGQERAKRHSAGYGEERRDLYGSYDSYGYSSGGYSTGCGCCHQNQDILLPLLLAGIAAAAGYFFGRDSNNNNGRSLQLGQTVSARTAQLVLQGQSSLLILVFMLSSIPRD